MLRGPHSTPPPTPYLQPFRTPPHCGPDALRIYGVPPRSNRGRLHPQSRLQNSQVQTLESHFCLKYTYMPIWLILHQRTTNNFSFLYFIYIITLTFKCIICVIFFCNSHDSSGPTGIIQTTICTRERLIHQEQTPPGTQLTENNI